LRLIDASAVIDLWEHYPIAQFPAVWDWIQAELAIAKVAMEEVGFRDPDCKSKLELYGILEQGIGNREAVEAVAIKSALGIVNEEYGSGVDENDILIIAIAKVLGTELVTNESLQPKLPTNVKGYKMPAVCALPGVQVATIRLLDYIRQSGRVFR